MSKQIITLYHQPGSRSTRIAWFFFELDQFVLSLDEVVQMKYINMQKGEHKTEEFLKINPLGTLPVCVDDKDTLIESGAILFYLAEKFQKTMDLIPKDESKYYQWVMYTVSTLDDIVVPLVVHLMFVPKEKQDSTFIETKVKVLKENLEFISKGLADNDYMIGNTFSIVDICLGYSLANCLSLNLLEDYKNLQTYTGKLSSREAFKRAFATEESEEVKKLKLELKKAKFENKILKGENKPTKIVLYHQAGSRSTRIAWLLDELGVEWEENQTLKAKGFLYTKSDEFLQVNPQGTLPAIVDGNLKLFEAGAIIHYVLLKYKKEVEEKGLIPKNWTEENIRRNDLYQFWCIATMDGKVLNVTQLVTSFLGSSFTKTFLLSNSVKNWWDIAGKVIAEDLGDNEYIQGKEFTITDFYLGLTLAHINVTGILINSPKKLIEYHNRLMLRPAFKKAASGGIFTFNEVKL